MKMKNQRFFKFFLEETVTRKGKEYDPLVVCACAVYINNQVIYFCQPKQSYEEESYIPVKCTWIYEHDLKLVK